MLVEVLLVVLNFVLEHKLMEFLDLSELVFIMLDLAVVKEAASLLALLCLLLFLWVRGELLFGKKK